MGISPEPSQNTALRRSQRGADRARRRGPGPRRSFTAALHALEQAAEGNADLAVHVVDLDTERVVLTGDAHVPLPIAGLGVVPLLIEVAAAFQSGELDPAELVDRATVEDTAAAGLWRRATTDSLPLADLATLTAASGDALAANALLERIGLERVRARIDALGLRKTALLDRFRDDRGPDDAPHFAVGSARDLASLFAGLAAETVVSPEVSAQVTDWLTGNEDLTLAAAATGLDPFAHDRDPRELLLVNKTGRGRGIRAESGILAGHRAALAYTLIVHFDDLSVLHRLRAQELFRVLGAEMMEYVY